MKACPKCKGTEGYVYDLIVRYYQECDWEGNPTAADIGQGTPRDDSKMVECVECGARFRRSTIERE